MLRKSLLIPLMYLLVGSFLVLPREAFAWPWTKPQPRAAMQFGDAYRDGVVLVLWANYSPEQINGFLDRILETGTDHVTIPVFGCQSDIHSSDVGSCEVRLQTAGTIHGNRPFAGQPFLAAELAVQKGFKVTFLPIVVTKNWEWRGFFDPKDVDGWFRTYTAWITELAKRAQELGSTEFVAGTEFSNLYRQTERWKKVLREIRKHFHGPVVVTVNWGDIDHGFWDEADAIGVSAYYPVSHEKDPSQDELDRGWAKIRKDLLAASKKYRRPLHLTEIGYTSTSHAAKMPWATPEPGEGPDLALQSRLYEAFRKAWETDRTLVRTNMWATGNPEDDNPPLGFEFINKPAENQIREFFAARRLLK